MSPLRPVERERELGLGKEKNIFLILMIFQRAFGSHRIKNKYVINMNKKKKSLLDMLEGIKNDPFWEAWPWMIEAFNLIEDVLETIKTP